MDAPTFHPLFEIGTDWAYALICFLFGACVGSFLNVVIYRLPHHISVLRPGSRCPGCGRTIRPWENIPILSWLLMFGKCRGCKSPIHWRYPGVELLTGLLWGVTGLLYWNLQGWTFPIPADGPGIDDGFFLMLEGPEIIRIFTLISLLWFVSALISISFIDYDLTIIPDELNFAGLGVSLTLSFLLPNLHFPVAEDGTFTQLWFGAVSPHLNGLMASGVGMAAGAGSIYLLSLIGTLTLKSTIERVQATEDEEVDSAMGFGDVKLMAFLGAFLGWQAILLVFFFACVLGSVVGVAVKFMSGAAGDTKGLGARLRARWESGNSMIPFGPFLCVAALILMYWKRPILDLAGSYFGVITGG
ncbi:MAG: prepilin peptidase [Planctomycetota bacterium]|jgi:leader peptidase (prepilin peptidase)/N-methyltransferase